MRIVRSSERSYFRADGAKPEVSILAGKSREHGGFRNHTVAIVRLPAASRLDRHFHREREESYLVVSGRGEAIVNGDSIALAPGDLLSVSPGEVHQLLASDSESLEYVVVTAPAWAPEDVHR